MRTYSEPFVGLSWVFFFSSVFCPISCTHQILCWYLYFQEPKYKQILRKKELYIDLKSTILDLLNGRKIDSVSHYTLPYLNVIIFKITKFKNGSPCIPISARGAQGNNHIILVKMFKSFFSAGDFEKHETRKNSYWWFYHLHKQKFMFF